MTIQNLLIAGFLLINFTQIKCNGTESTTLPTGTSEISTSDSETTGYSSASTEATSLITQSSPTYVTSSVTQISPTYVTSSNVPTSANPVTTTQPQNVTEDLIYQFSISSSQPLKLGNFTNTTILNSVQAMVNSAFNTTYFSITVIRVEIRSSARALFSYQMLTENLFQTSSNCLVTCIQNAALNSTPTQSFELLTNDSVLVNVTAQSAPVYISGGTTITTTTTTTANNYPTGEPPPGVAGQLGMGLGISIIAVLLIVEVIFLYRKYGFNPSSTRQTPYEMNLYQQRLSD